MADIGLSKNLSLTWAGQLSKNRFIFNFNNSLNARQINIKLKMTKFKFKTLKNASFLNGFYRAIW
jgi:hypothetical protein